MVFKSQWGYCYSIIIAGPRIHCYFAHVIFRQYLRKDEMS